MAVNIVVCGINYIIFNDIHIYKYSPTPTYRVGVQTVLVIMDDAICYNVGAACSHRTILYQDVFISLLPGSRSIHVQHNNTVGTQVFRYDSCSLGQVVEPCCWVYSPLHYYGIGGDPPL